MNTSGGTSTPIPGTPEIREKQIQNDIQNEKITTEGKRNETSYPLYPFEGKKMKFRKKGTRSSN